MSAIIERGIQAMEKIYDDALEQMSIDRENLREDVKYLGFNQKELNFFKMLS